MNVNDTRLHYMGEAQEATDELVSVIEALCAMCAAAGIDYDPYLAQVLCVIVDYLEL